MLFALYLKHYHNDSWRNASYAYRVAWPDGVSVGGECDITIIFCVVSN